MDEYNEVDVDAKTYKDREWDNAGISHSREASIAPNLEAIPDFQQDHWDTRI